uniref:Platelet-derived growth factor D n=2 Tax=Sinocyclocheilus grahami TaxID=75366 RepID=A0A672MJ43_SINGR
MKRILTFVCVVFVYICVCLFVSEITDSNRLTDLYRKEEVIMVKSGGHIQSPRFPNSYPRNLLLSWKLLSPPHTRILLEFDAQFGLEEAENGVCRYDYVEVEDISETSTIIWGRWCGQRAPSRISSKTNLIKITFKSDDYFVAKPGFKICYSLLDRSPLASLTNWEAVTVMSFDGLYGCSKPVHLALSLSVDLDRLYDDVKQYSCTPRNFSVNLREELKATNTVFFPRCLLVQRCGGNCACGTDNWNSCSCSAGKIVKKLHEVLKFSPGPSFYRKKTHAQWILEEIHLQHHERCDCVCQSRPPRCTHTHTHTRIATGHAST